MLLPSVAERQAGAHNPCLFLALADYHVISTLCPACLPNSVLIMLCLKEELHARRPIVCMFVELLFFDSP
jgi:hypothetical protein